MSELPTRTEQDAREREIEKVGIEWMHRAKEAEERVATLESERDGYRDAIRRWVEARTYAQRIMAQRRFRSLLDASHDQER